MFCKVAVSSLLILPLACIAQQTKSANDTRLSISAPYGVVDAEEKYYFSNENDLVAVKIDGKKFTLQKHDLKKPGFEKVTEYQDFPKDFLIESIQDYNNQLCVFFSVNNKKTDVKNLFCRKIDYNTGVFNGPATEFLAIKSLNLKFTFYSSYDNKRLLVQYRLKPTIRDDSKSFEKDGLYVFDEELKQIWGGEITMPYTEKKMNLLDFGIDGEGITYILAQVFNDETTNLKKEKGGPANYHIELLRISEGNQKPEITKLNVKDKFIENISLQEGPNNKMYCAGYYSQGGRKISFSGADREISGGCNVNGIFMFTTDKSGLIDKLSTHEIPLETIRQYSSKSAGTTEKSPTKSKDNVELGDVVIREVNVNRDGSLVISGEQYYKVTNYSYSRPGYASATTTTTTYYYNDILASKIDSSGKLSWIKRLPKKQMGYKGQGEMSFKYLNEPLTGDHYFVFIDNDKNASKAINEIPNTHMDGRGGFMTYYKIDNVTGKTTKKTVADMKDIQGMKLYQFSTNRILETAGAFVFEAYKKDKEDVLIKVNLTK